MSRNTIAALLLASMAALAGNAPSLAQTSNLDGAKLRAGTVTPSKISTSGAGAGYVLTYNGTSAAWAASASGSGTVTSVGLSVPGLLYSISGSPVTASGTITETLLTQTANTVLAGPATGSAAAPTFRNLAVADMPPSVLLSSGSYSNPAWLTSLAYSKLTGTPTVPTVASTSNLLAGDGAGNASSAGFAASDVARLSTANTLSGTLQTAKVGIGAATSSTYYVNLAPTSGTTVGSTVFVQDATATFGKTKVVIKGGAADASGQHALEFQDSTGAVNAFIGSAGDASLGQGGVTFSQFGALGVNSGLNVTTVGTGGIGATYKWKYTGQTADMIQVQDNTSAVLGGVNAHGEPYVATSGKGFLMQDTASPNHWYRITLTGGALVLTDTGSSTRPS